MLLQKLDVNLLMIILLALIVNLNISQQKSVFHACKDVKRVLKQENVQHVMVDIILTLLQKIVFNAPIIVLNVSQLKQNVNLVSMVLISA